MSKPLTPDDCSARPDTTSNPDMPVELKQVIIRMREAGMTNDGIRIIEYTDQVKALVEAANEAIDANDDYDPKSRKKINRFNNAMSDLEDKLNLTGNQGER